MRMITMDEQNILQLPSARERKQGSASQKVDAYMIAEGV